MGPDNMVERCLIQMLVEMITNQHSLEEVLHACQMLANES